MHLTCPKCGNNKINANVKRPQCGKCRYCFPRNKSANNQPTSASKKSAISISDDIMHGNILDALEKANIDPFNNNGKLSKDFIPLLLKDDELKLAFSKYCEQKKKQPLWVVKKAIALFLKVEGLYEK